MALNAPPFVIRELSGDGRTIKLVGRGLPKPPLTLKTNQRMELTWLPGSPTATTTVLGAEEEATSISGKWSTAFFGEALLNQAPPCMEVNNEIVAEVEDACDVMDSFCRLGQQIEVVWGRQIRHGFLASFEKKWANPNDVEWTMEFKWTSRGEKPGPAVLDQDVSPGDVFGGLKQQLADLSKIVNLTATAGSFLDSLQNFRNSIEDLVNSVENQVQDMVLKVTEPIRVMRGIVSTLNGLKDELALMGEFIQSEVGGAINGEESTAEAIDEGADPLLPLPIPVYSDPFDLPTFPIESQDYSERLSSQRYIEELKAWASQLRRFAIEGADQLQDQIGSDILATYLAPAGMDLRTVSQMFYQTAFEWRRIMLFNLLEGSFVEAPILLLIPKINPQDSAQNPTGGI